MSIKISREWATPAAIGVFGLMAITGLLMFFHLDSGLQKTVHEWAGWLVVAAVVAHATANWLGFKRYFTIAGKAPAILGVCALLLAGTFVSLPGAAEQASPPALAMRAMSQAPVVTVAALFGKTGEQAVKDLAAAGIVLPNDQASIGSAIGGDRGKMGQALRAISQKAS